jgi:hypothetical protein
MPQASQALTTVDDIAKINKQYRLLLIISLLGGTDLKLRRTAWQLLLAET